MMMMMMICNQIRNSLPVLVRSLGMYAQHASQSVSQSTSQHDWMCYAVGPERMSFLAFTMNFFLPRRRRAAPLSCCFDFGLSAGWLATMNDVFLGQPRRPRGRWWLFFSTTPTTTADGCSMLLRSCPYTEGRNVIKMMVPPPPRRER